jgi:hypothetical protein
LPKRTGQRLAAAFAVVLAVACAALWRAKSASRADGSRDVPSASPPVEDAAPAAQATGPAPRPLPAPAPSAAQLGELDEARLMARLRVAAGSDPGLAVKLAREGNRRFPDSADAPERSSILIHALAAQGLASQARGEAEDMVNHYPDSEWVREIERFTGAHRHRNIRVNDAGVLEYYQ